MAAPLALSSDLLSRDIETDTGSPIPFDGARELTSVKLRPAETGERQAFLSVIAPRRASEPAEIKVQPTHDTSTRGVRVTHGITEDVAVFAIEQPEIRRSDVSATGRSCLVRRRNGRVSGAALHNGQALVADGMTLFETDNSGHVALAFSENSVEAALQLYNPKSFAIHAHSRPTAVVVDGQKAPFAYDTARQLVQVERGRARHVRMSLQ